MLRIVAEEDPPNPSMRLTSLGEGLAEVARRRQTHRSAFDNCFGETLIGW